MKWLIVVLTVSAIIYITAKAVAEEIEINWDI